ncbi:MAG: hypothetical protein D6830_03620 [Ignavibacteria bacterium]|nr:MAG: hypothetical protein D6830_03620 [Ignavibacteria bacterium]
MDLIEIVQQSLTYFGILAVIVIVGSYISYKVRRKLSGEKLPYEDDLQKAKEALKAQKKAAKKKTSEDKKEEEVKDLKKPIIIKADQKKQIHVKKKIHEKTGTNKITEEEYRKKKEEYRRKKEELRRKKRKATQIFTRRHRIEIINKNFTPSVGTPTESKTPDPTSIRARKTEEAISPKKKKLHSLNDDVLGKYADKDEDQFYTIRPGKKEE